MNTTGAGRAAGFAATGITGDIAEYLARAEILLYRLISSVFNIILPG